MNAPGIPEILFILIVALVIFGPRKLPELGKSLGAGLREFRRSTQGLKEEFEGVMSDVKTETHAAPVQPAQVQVISAQPQVILPQDAAVPRPPVTSVPVTQVVQPEPVGENTPSPRQD